MNDDEAFKGWNISTRRATDFIMVDKSIARSIFNAGRESMRDEVKAVLEGMEAKWHAQLIAEALGIDLEE